MPGPAPDDRIVPPPPETAPPGQGAACETCWIVGEADHRIANHLSMLAGLVRLKSANLATRAQPPSREDVSLLLDGIFAQIEAIGGLHRLLAKGGRLAEPDLAAQLHHICSTLGAAAPGRARLIEDLGPGCRISADQGTVLTLIVAEVLTNALKHAQAGPDVSVIRLSCAIDAAGEIAVEISDNGPGFPPGFDPELDGGLGFRLVHMMARQLGARVIFSSTPAGVRFRLTVRGAA